MWLFKTLLHDPVAQVGSVFEFWFTMKICTQTLSHGVGPTCGFLRVLWTLWLDVVYISLFGLILGSGLWSLVLYLGND